jgi:hypothetical protein
MIRYKFKFNFLWLSLSFFIWVLGSFAFNQTAQLRSADCGRSNVGQTQVLYANPTGAVGYRFEFKNIELNQTQVIDKSVRSITLSEFTNIARYNCNYEVRVALNTGSGFGSYGPICPILSAPLISTLRSVDCPKSLIVWNSPVYSNINPIYYPNTDYWDFEVRRADDYTVSEQVLNRPNHEFSLSMTSNPALKQSSTTYEVRVRTSQSGILQPWGTWCSITTPAGGPQITWGCGQTLEYLSYQSITCTSMAGATQYEFMLRSGSNLLAIKSSTTNSIKLDVFVDGSGIPIYNYGSNYKIAARALINGVWTSWGNLCSFSTTQEPHSEVMSQCGSTLAAFTTPISFYAVANANYTFELTDLTPGMYNDGVQTITQLSRQIRMNQFARWSWGHQYSIRCKLMFKGVTYNFSTACTINSPNAICGLRAADCPKTLTTTGSYVSSVIMTTDKPVDVTAYQYRIGGSVSAWKYGTAGRNITLQEILGVAPSLNTTYPVEVRVMHEDVAQNWGWICNITTPLAIGIDNNIEIKDDNLFSLDYLNIYPNPLDDNSDLFIEVKDVNTDVYKLFLYNFNGQLIQDFESTNENRIFKTNLANSPGVYFLKVFKGEALIEIRKVIKT